jgi:SAM-dependent methyltransferase
MSEASDHYERLLSRHYTWMFGTSFAEKVAEQKSVLAQAMEYLGTNRTGGLAVDLGCGPGFQSVALSQLGFSPVIAIDTSAALLQELQERAILQLDAQGLPIQTHHADIRELPDIVTSPSAGMIVCMGDTLTHLQQKSDVSGLFNAIYNSLVSGGIFVLTWRDLITELHGVDRFIPVRSDENTIMTCFLEYSGPDKVTVYDLVYTRTREGWTLNKSSYHKLRLSADWITRQLEGAGLTVEFEGAAGRLLEIIARKP